MSSCVSIFEAVMHEILPNCASVNIFLLMLALIPTENNNTAIFILLIIIIHCNIDHANRKSHNFKRVFLFSDHTYFDYSMLLLICLRINIDRPNITRSQLFTFAVSAKMGPKEQRLEGGTISQQKPSYYNI